MAGITFVQAQEAKRLVNDAEAYGSLIALASQLPAEILARIREAHEDATTAMCCNAHREGLDCCIDILLTDPARFAPERVAEAQGLLARYRAQVNA